MADEVAINRRNILDYFEITFNQHAPALAAKKYVRSDYVHHGPGCDGNRESFVEYFSQYFKQFPQFRGAILQCVAEGAFVVLRAEIQCDEDSSPIMVAEFYKMKNGKISEHWDVVQDARLVLRSPAI